jgi:pyruvate dehydrogenase E2 component (dihydrolipoamide acetyltransferase)
MGADMVEGTIVKWLKHDGDAVERGEIIAEIETDKANVEIEAFEGGTFRTALAAEGDTVPVGGVIAIIAASDDDISKYTNGEVPAAAPASPIAPRPMPAAASSEARPAAATAPTTTPSPLAQPAGDAGIRVRISPVARNLAEQHQIDPRTIRGTGPDGRIVRRDIEAAIGAPATSDRPPAINAPSKMRQAIARRMSQSKREAPHYYLLTDVDMTDAIELRRQLNDTLPEGERVSINDLIVRASAIALKRYPEFNATIAGEQITQHEAQHVCIAIAMDDGLIAPAILDAGAKTLPQIAADARDLATRAKTGALRQREITDGTFTVTNLGAYGVEALIGIIQPPQTAILGVGTVAPRPAVRDNAIVIRQLMKVALSADHRVTDGAQGAQFLSEIKRVLEHPLLEVL